MNDESEDGESEKLCEKPDRERNQGEWQRRQETKAGRGRRVGGRGPVTSCDMWRGLHHSQRGVCVSLCLEDGEEDAERLWLLAFY